MLGTASTYTYNVPVQQFFLVDSMYFQQTVPDTFEIQFRRAIEGV